MNKKIGICATRENINFVDGYYFNEDYPSDKLNLNHFEIITRCFDNLKDLKKEIVELESTYYSGLYFFYEGTCVPISLGELCSLGILKINNELSEDMCKWYDYDIEEELWHTDLN